MTKEAVRKKVKMVVNAEVQALLMRSALPEISWMQVSIAFKYWGQFNGITREYIRTHAGTVILQNVLSPFMKEYSMPDQVESLNSCDDVVRR